MYWRRRAVLLLGLVVFLLLTKSCVGSGSPSKTALVRPTPTSTLTPTPTPTSTATPTSSPIPTVVPTPTPTTATPVAIPSCTDAALAVTTSTDAPIYAVTATPKLTMSIKNRSATACRRDLGSGAVELLVSSGSDRVWSSDDCSVGKGVALATLPSGGSQAVALTWSGKRSVPGCRGSREQVKAGTYRVVARVGTLRKVGAAFRVRSG